MDGIRMIRRRWGGHIVADMKVTDGALGEVDMAHDAGATAITVMGSAPRESIDLFIERCSQLNMLSMIDLLGVDDPLAILRPLQKSPDIIVIHRGRDEENTQGKLIRYRQINRIRSKFDSLISAAGGVDLREARSAIFNGANIVVANIVRPQDGWTGINITDNITEISQKFLETIS
jgi:3-keto-L-gulonate-6-phosphate decarboxylase